MSSGRRSTIRGGGRRAAGDPAHALALAHVQLDNAHEPVDELAELLRNAPCHLGHLARLARKD